MYQPYSGFPQQIPGYYPPSNEESRRIVKKEPKPYTKEKEIKESERREIIYHQIEREISIPQPPKTEYKEELQEKEVWIEQPPKKMKIREVVEREVLVNQPPIKKKIQEKVLVSYQVEQPPKKQIIFENVPKEVIYKVPAQTIKVIKEVRDYNPPHGIEEHQNEQVSQGYFSSQVSGPLI